MELRTLGTTSLEVSPIGLGGMGFISRNMTFTDADALIRRALELGVTLFDTARGYYDSEKILGSVLKPSEGIIASKSFLRSARGIRKELEESLRLLRRNTIDLYQIHHIQYETELEEVSSPNGAIEALLEAKHKGLIRCAGLSGHKPDILLKALELDVFDTVQFPFNPIEEKPFSPVMELANSKGVGILIMKPFAGGTIKSTDSALRFALSFPVSSVLVGCQKPSELEEDVRIASTTSVLLEDELERLREEIRALDEKFCRRCRYCEPNCPQQIPISEVFRAESYLIMNATYARDEYRRLGLPARNCQQCGRCEEICPYELPVCEMLQRAHKRLTRGKFEDAIVKTLRRLGLYDTIRRIYFKLGGPLPRR